MSSLEDKLNSIEEKIKSVDFRQNSGNANEVNYHIFDYPARDEQMVRSHVSYLVNKINKSNYDFKIVEFNLYEIVMQILKDRGYLEKCFDFEKTKGTEYMYEAIIKLLRITTKDNLIVNHILENTNEGSVVFITGVGMCYPIVRSHNILNNLHQVLDTVPVVMFFPGAYSGQVLQLFGTIKDDNYYRANKF
ncbi:MAG TPA: DUF1788 domain-containing protein [Clostridiales bacterium]|nr:MAG: hypothetical protein A2Y18_05160 [Clostridiales bacterium GWD2_32_19]HCC06814.1 DUF1788 domain-containing protein [Clostridiales bacterium]